MTPDFTPLFVLAISGLGAIAGAGAAIPFLLLGIWFPACLWIAGGLPVAGSVIGLLIGSVLK